MNSILLSFLVCCIIIAVSANDLAPLVYQNFDASSQSQKKGFQGISSLSQKLNSKLDALRSKFTRPTEAIQSKSNPISNSKRSPMAAMKNIRDVEFKVMKTSARKKLLSTLSFFKGGSNNKKKVLILMSDTGGGHRASAQALDQALQDQFPGRFDVEIMDIWTDHAKWPYNKFVPVYRYLAKHPILWRGFYAYGTFPVTRKLTEVASWRSCYDSFRRAIESSNPDFVVSVHPLCQLMPISIIQDMNKKRRRESKSRIPFITIVTDLGGAHNTWFDNRADACYVPSEAVRNIALKNGVEPRKLILKGLPIRPSFWKESKPKMEVRKSLGIDEYGKTVLLMGGGDGVGGIGSIATALAGKLKSLNFTSQLIVICGHNKKMSEALKNSLVPQKNLKVIVKGFVNNIDEFMTASDCLITKAGPGTIAESMIRGLPLVLSSYLPGQEYGNVPFVVKGGFGVYTGNRPRKIAETVSNLFRNQDQLAEMSVRAKMMSHPEATMSIARDIGETMLMKPVETIRL